MTIFTNVRKSIDYKVFILLNVHPAGKDQIEPYNMKSIHCSDFITQNVHPAQNRTENSVQFFCIIGYLDKN